MEIDMTCTSESRSAESVSVPSTDHGGDAQSLYAIAIALFATAWPLLLGNLLNSLTGTGMTLWFGHLMGDRAIAVASFFYPIMFFLVSLVMGVSTGATVVAGKAHGAQDARALKNLAKTVLLVGGGLGLAIAALGVLFLEVILDGMKAPSSIRGAFEIYACGMLAFVPFLFVSLSLSALLRGIGRAGLASRLVAITSFSTLSLAPLLILLGNGYDGYGTAAYGAASVMAHLAAFVHFHRHAKKHALPFDLGLSTLSAASFDRNALREVLGIGLPSSLQMNLTSLSQVAIMTMIVHGGEQAGAGFGAANQVLGYAQYPVYSLGIAASILCAQAIGAGDQVKFRRIGSASLMLAVIMGAVVACTIAVFEKPLLALFLQGQESIRIAGQYLGLGLIGLFFSGIAAVLCGLLRANGDTWWPSIIALAAIWGVQIPMAHILQAEYGLFGVWCSFPLGAGVSLIATTIYYLIRHRRAAMAVDRAPSSEHPVAQHPSASE
jgi:putative MATE family efflux protein